MSRKISYIERTTGKVDNIINVRTKNINKVVTLSRKTEVCISHLYNTIQGMTSKHTIGKVATHCKLQSTLLYSNIPNEIAIINH